MEKHTDSQYDDDLTIGVSDFESDAIDTDYVDLFEFSGGEESPISRLKTIMLEIDWEITDEVLIQFNEELLDLKDIWSDDPIKLVYVQALEKISKYIYQKKSDAHPSAIRLLMSFYYNLEKIDIDTELTQEEKKTILKGDLQKFEKLKRHISPSAAPSPPVQAAEPRKVVMPPVTVSEGGVVDPSLFNLKACILGMDWEITDLELSHLSQEVKKLEKEFSGHKIRLLFLQGISALGGYIKLKKSDSHADAFKILYAFFEGLEKIVGNKLSIEEEKAILLAEVAKFNQFKKVIAPTITPEAISVQTVNEQAAEYAPAVDTVAPAFSGMEDEDAHGFQAEEEVADLKGDSPDDVLERLDSFFTGDSEPSETADSPSTGLQEPESFAPAVSTEEALRGVEVETEADDDSEEEALPTVAGGILAPALADAEDEERGFSAEITAEIIAAESDGVTTDEIEDRLSGFFEEEPVPQRRETDTVAALEGVAVETDGNDDSGGDSLSLAKDESPAPALSDSEEDHGFLADADESPALDIDDQQAGVSETEDDSDEGSLFADSDDIFAPALSDFAEDDTVLVEPEAGKAGAEADDLDDGVSVEAIEDRLSGFFDDESDEMPTSIEIDDTGGALSEPEDEQVTPLVGVDVETEADDDSDLEALPTEFDGVIAPALSDTEEGAERVSAFADEGFSADDGESAADLEARLSQFFDAEPEAETAAEGETQGRITEPPVEEEAEIFLIETDLEEEAEDLFSEPAVEEEAEILFTEPAVEEEEEGLSTEFAVEEDGEDLIAETETLLDETAVDDELDSFFDELKTDEDGADVFTESAAEGEANESDGPSGDIGLAPELADGAVIFEAIDQSEEAVASFEDLPVAKIIEEDTAAPPQETTYTTFDSEADEKDFFAEIDDKVDEPGEFKQEILEEVDELQPESLKLPAEAPPVDEGFPFAEEMDEVHLGVGQETGDDSEIGSMDDAFSFSSDDPLSDLRTSIASLGIEINEQITGSILSEVNSLRHHFMARPIEKTLLQLIATIVEHIRQYGYESSAESHGLLVSAFAKLEQIQVPQTDSVQAQEVVLAETCKVLLWQQSMLDRQAIRKGEQLTFLDPLRSEAKAQDFPEPSEGTHGAGESIQAADDTIEFDDEFRAEFEPVGDGSTPAQAEVEPDSAEPDEMLSPQPDAFGQVDVLLESDTTLDPAAADFIKKEIESLKESLRAEIADLRNRLLDQR